MQIARQSEACTRPYVLFPSPSYLIQPTRMRETDCVVFSEVTGLGSLNKQYKFICTITCAAPDEPTLKQTLILGHSITMINLIGHLEHAQKYAPSKVVRTCARMLYARITSEFRVQTRRYLYTACVYIGCVMVPKHVHTETEMLRQPCWAQMISVIHGQRTVPSSIKS